MANKSQIENNFDHLDDICFVSMQVEFHSIAWMDQRRSSNIEIMSDETWCGSMGSDSRQWSVARETDPATEWPDAAPVGTAVFGGIYWSSS